MEDKQQKAQEIYSQLQIIEHQIKRFQQQMQAVEGQFIELKLAERSIEEFKKLKKGDEILTPLTGGIFMKGKFGGDNELLLNVGSNVVVRKKPDEAKDIITAQIGQLIELKDKISNEIEKLAHHGESFHNKLQSLISEK